MLGLGDARGDEVLRRARLFDGGDGAEARAGQRPGAVDHLVEHGLKVQARADAQARRAERGDARAQRLVFGRRRLALGHRFLPAPVAGALPARSGTDSLADRSPGSGRPDSVLFPAGRVEIVMNSCEIHVHTQTMDTTVTNFRLQLQAQFRARGVRHGGRAGRVEGARLRDARNRVRGAKGRQAVRELGKQFGGRNEFGDRDECGGRNESFVGYWRHRREEGTADLPGGGRAVGTDRSAPRPTGRASLSPGPGSSRRTVPPCPSHAGASLRQLLRPRANAVTLLRGARAAAFALAALAALALGLPGEAQAQTVTTFITNAGQAGVTSSITARATAFTTGGNTAGYELTSVDIRTGTSLVSLTPRVEIFRNGATDLPETRLVTLTNPGTITDDSFNTFTDPANTVLSANTVYWLVVSNDAAANGSGLRVSTTTNATADSGAAMGWSIGNALWQSDVRSEPWSTTVLRIIFAVKGTPAIGIAPASAPEGDAVTFTATLAAAATQAVTVDYATSVAASDTAAQTDFTAGSGTLTFAAGETQQTFTVGTGRGQHRRVRRDVHGDPGRREPARRGHAAGGPDGDRYDH